MTDAYARLMQRAAAIELAVFDVDGVMTDGCLYLADDGREIKTFNVRDGLGLKRLQAAGVTVAVISGRPSTVVARRMAELGVEHVYLGRDDKRIDFDALLDQLGIDADRAAVMGDDLPDLVLMQRAGLALTVADAIDEVHAAAHWISRRVGGAGAVREACELIIAAREEAGR